MSGRFGAIPLLAAAAILVAGGLQALWTGGAAAQGAGPVDDIVGLRPGMSFGEIVGQLEARDDVESVETAEQWVRQSNGIPTRQLVRAANGIACAQDEKASQDGYLTACDTLGGRFQPRKEITNEIVVAFTGMPDDEVARSIWRHSVFPEGRQPTVDSVIAALVEKYGRPHIVQAESGYYSMSHRHGATNLNWVYAPDGTPITGNDVMKQRCVNGPKPWFAAEHSWNGGCDLTIRAEILPVPGNGLLTQLLNVSVVQQKDFIAALGNFDAALKAAVELRARESAAKPEL